MPKTICFDTSIYDHIYKYHSGPNNILGHLSSAVDRREIQILASFETLSEIADSFNKSEQIFKDELALFKELADCKHPLKPSDQIIRDDIRSFATIGRATTPFAQPGTRTRRLFLEGMDLLSKPLPQVRDELQAIAEENKKNKESFFNMMKEFKTDTLSRFNIKDIQNKDFNSYWDMIMKPGSVAWSFAKGLAERAGVGDICEERGLDKLLKVKSVYAAVAYYLSLYYSQVIEGRAPQRGDMGDSRHAILAASAEVFVTQDCGLYRILSRIPHLNYETINLSELATRLKKDKEDRDITTQ